MKGVNKIFVYGTLMDGFLEKINPQIALHIKKWKNGKINARLFDLGEYPGARSTSSSKEVTGEICVIDQIQLKEVLSVLDEYEDYDAEKEEESLYLRKVTKVITADGDSIKAWVYWYNKPVNEKQEIEGGDYKKYLKRNK